MTCAECQELLLDLAYGELDTAQAAQVEAHARDCARCGPELAQLQATRRLLAPLAEVEEPPSRIDTQVMQAARAQALLLGGGTRGPVIAAAAARVEQPTLSGARVDVRARVRARPPDTRDRRRSWMIRAAVAGSLVAAGLALLVSGKAERAAPRIDETAYQIQIRTPEVAQAEARRAAEAQAGATAKSAPARSEPAPAAKPEEAPPVSAPPMSAPPPAGLVAAPPPPAPAEPVRAQAESKRSRKAAVPRESPDDDASGAALDHLARATPPPAAPGSAVAGAGSAGRGAEGAHAAPLGLLGRSDAAGSAADAAPPASPGSTAPRVAAKVAAAQEQPRAAPALLAAPPAPAASAPAAAAAGPEESAAVRPATEKKAEAAKGAADAGAPDALALERRAESERRAGAYASAAGLYRSAARLRRDLGDDAAGWDLAHAVECWAAAGRFAEAQADRDELSRGFPTAAGPSGAADRALRAAPADARSR